MNNLLKKANKGSLGYFTCTCFTYLNNLVLALEELLDISLLNKYNIL